MPIDHIALTTKDIGKLAAFYEAALRPLGYAERFNILDGALRGFGPENGPADLWLSALPPSKIPPGFEDLPLGAWGGPLHIAFKAESKEQVHAFHEAALALGASDNGAPGPRQAIVTEYAAFVFDPDGRNIEVNYVTPKA